MRSMLQVPKDFPERLSAAIARRGQTVSGAAVAFGMSLSTLSKLCNGKLPVSSGSAAVLEIGLGSGAWAYCMAKSNELPPVRS
jgi:hypothetical protein